MLCCMSLFHSMHTQTHTHREYWLNRCVLPQETHGLNHEGPDFTSHLGLQSGDWNSCLRVIITSYGMNIYTSYYRIWAFFSFLVLSFLCWQRKKGNKGQILIDLVNMDVCRVRKNTSGKWLIAFIMVSIVRTLAFAVAAECSLLSSRFLNGTDCAFF